MATAEAIVRFGFPNKIEVPEGDTQSAVFRASKGQLGLRQIVKRLYETVVEIQADRELTAEGKAKKIKKAAMVAMADLDKARETFLVPVESRLKELAGQFSLIVSPTEEASLTIREVELRQFLLALDTAARFKTFQDALEAGDELTFRAFANAPKQMELMSEAILQEGLQAWAEKRDPATAGELSAVRAAKEALSENLADAYRGVGELGKITDNSLRTRVQEATVGGET